MNATKITALSVAALFLARGPATGCDTSTGDTPLAPSSPPAATSPAVPDSQWVVTDANWDPEFGRDTVICVDHHGNLQAATEWRELATTAPVGAPCPAGAVLINTDIASP